MKTTYLILISLCMSHLAAAQGCIPIRNLAGFGQFALPEYNSINEDPVKWIVSVNNRYFKSYKMYDGTNPVSEPPEDFKTNHNYTLSIDVLRVLQDGWSIAVSVPFIAASRETWQEHNPSKQKYTVNSFGLGDVRLTAYKWILDTSTPNRGNIQFGLGLKLPTGDYQYEDYFHKTSGLVLAPVSSTIQLGDGGTGFSVEVNGYYTVSRVLGLYGNAFYLLNPRDHNGVSNTFGGPPRVPGHPTIDGAIAVEATANVNSVPDSYTVRAGGTVAVNKYTFWAGLRSEGQPVKDLVGQNNGQRRAGNILSFEPGINYKLPWGAVYVFVPTPIYRKTKQTVPDQRISQLSGEYVSSPGSFADVLFFVGAVVKL